MVRKIVCCAGLREESERRKNVQCMTASSWRLIEKLAQDLHADKAEETPAEREAAESRKRIEQLLARVNKK